MNCEQCQELISAYLDCELDETGCANVRAHLSVCAECAALCEDLAMLVDVSCLDADAAVPPNPQTLWLRINNIIEGEVNAEIARENKAKAADNRTGRWHLSFSQIAAAVAGIALVSSLLTFIGIRQYVKSEGEIGRQSEPTIVDRFLGKLGLVDTPQEARKRRMQERATAIDYWNKRVQARRMQWDTHLRDAFDRNLNEIDQAVNEYTMILEENPQDELSGEMLDTALNEKMELLREFSEL
jgi:hypothetical protein